MTEPAVEPNQVVTQTAWVGVSLGGMIAATAAEGFIGWCQDQATPPAMAEALAERIEGARLHVIKGAAHRASVEQPADFDVQIDAFLAENA